MREIPAPAGAAPLHLHVTPGAPLHTPITEPERFYLLAELIPYLAAEPPRATLNFALLISRALAVHDPALSETRRALSALAASLLPDDRLTLVAFGDGVDTLLDGASVTGRRDIESLIAGAPPSRGAPLSMALDGALRRLGAHGALSQVSALALVVDETAPGDEMALLEVAEQARRMGVPIVAFGLGLAWNGGALDRLASLTGGSCAYVDDPRYLTPGLTDLVERLRGTLALRLRLTLEPAPGVSVLRAAQVAPELVAAFAGPHTPGAPVTVELGSLAGGPDARSNVALWETLLEPSSLTYTADGHVELGVIRASYWALWQDGGRNIHIQIPARTLVSQTWNPLASDVRLALELLTAYRMLTEAEILARAGELNEAFEALNTSALRLAAADDPRQAEDARHAATALYNDDEDGLSLALRVRYSMRNHSPFHDLRRARGATGDI